MSKITNPTTEASVTCGFYNSFGDRTYDATQISSIFSGIIKDGIFASIGDALVVKADSGTIVNVGVGKAWFNSTWTRNDAILPINCGESEVSTDRIDAIVLEVNASESVRDNFIKLIKGTPSSIPSRPIMINNSNIHQYPLCYIYRKAESTSITQADITNMVGSLETPFITGILETVSLDTLLGQWRSELDNFVAAEERDMDEWHENAVELMQNVLDEIIAWTGDIKEQMSSDLATTFFMELSTEEIRCLLVNGLSDGTTVISTDGTVITSTDTSGRKLVKTFTNNFLTCTSVLIGAEGGEIGRLVKNFSADGLTINSEMTILYDPGVVINTLEDGDKIMY